MTSISHPAMSALSAALEDASGLLRVPVESLEVKSVETHEWPDSCLGLPRDGETCADVVTPGYVIYLGDGFTYHVDQQGNARRFRAHEHYADTEIWLEYTVEGGITGGTTTFRTNSFQLSEADEVDLRQLVKKADFFNIENPDPIPVVPDGIVRRLTVGHGRGNHTVVRGDGIDMEDSEAFHDLIAWVTERTPPHVHRGAMESPRSLS